MRTMQRLLLCAAAWHAILVSDAIGAEPVKPFALDGSPVGWSVRRWNDLSEPADPGSDWVVRDGMLIGSAARGTWLVSDREYGDFKLEFEFKLGPRGNGGCALRAPLDGDPAFDGLELQMADLRYNPHAKDSELTGGFYRALAPKRQVYRPEQWNAYVITLKGTHAHVVLNGEVIQDVDLSGETASVKRHDGTDAPPLKDRPLRGRIGFQELSRDGDQVRIRNVRLTVLDDPEVGN